MQPALKELINECPHFKLTRMLSSNYIQVHQSIKKSCLFNVVRSTVLHCNLITVLNICYAFFTALERK